jgi:thioredoxin-like negative regulator of GroEL
LAAARASDAVRVVVVDVQRHQELAARFKVTAVPLTVLDGGLAMTGVPDPAELVAGIRERGGAGHRQRLFASLLEGGRLDEAVSAITGDCAPFVAAWKTSTTGSRMGLLLVAEKLLERDARALDDGVVELLPVTTAEDAALRGDSADLLGQIGDPRARAALEKLLADANPDVVEIAGDALEALRSE